MSAHIQIVQLESRLDRKLQEYSLEVRSAIEDIKQNPGKQSHQRLRKQAQRRHRRVRTHVRSDTERALNM